METLDLKPVLPFLSMFLIIYLIGYFIIFRKWRPEIRPEASSCLMSLIHGTPAAFLAVSAILADRSFGFAAANTSFQNTVLDYSTAYFVADLLHLAAFFTGGDVLFVTHHFATLFVIVTCRHVASRGAFAVLFLLALAEATSAFQNAWTLAGLRRRDLPFAAKVFDLLSLPFYALYSVIRGLVGPYFVYRMVVFYLSGRAVGLIAKWVWVSWVVVVLMAIGLSITWVSNLWIQLYREKIRKLDDKIR